MSKLAETIIAHGSTIDVANGVLHCVCGEHFTTVAAHAAHVVEEVAKASAVTTEAELDELPEYTIIRALEERNGRKWPIGRIFEKTSKHRNEWMHLDPSDRYDGEDSQPAALIVNYYGTGGCTVLYRPEDGS
jgi:hypothetical protein